MHEVGQGKFDIKECRTEKFILQKLNYIHNNPCTQRWKLAEKPYEYLHSLARFYDGDNRVKDYLDVLAFGPNADNHKQLACRFYRNGIKALVYM